MAKVYLFLIQGPGFWYKYLILVDISHLVVFLPFVFKIVYQFCPTLHAMWNQLFPPENNDALSPICAVVVTCVPHHTRQRLLLVCLPHCLVLTSSLLRRVSRLVLHKRILLRICVCSKSNHPYMLLWHASLLPKHSELNVSLTGKCFVVCLQKTCMQTLSSSATTSFFLKEK